MRSSKSKLILPPPLSRIVDLKSMGLMGVTQSQMMHWARNLHGPGALAKLLPQSIRERIADTLRATPWMTVPELRLALVLTHETLSGIMYGSSGARHWRRRRRGNLWEFSCRK